MTGFNPVQNVVYLSHMYLPGPLTIHHRAYTDISLKNCYFSAFYTVVVDNNKSHDIIKYAIGHKQAVETGARRARAHCKQTSTRPVYYIVICSPPREHFDSGTANGERKYRTLPRFRQSCKEELCPETGTRPPHTSGRRVYVTALQNST